MKAPFNYPFLLGSFVSLLQLTPGLSFANELRYFMDPSKEIEAQAYSLTEQIQTTASSILSIPTNNQTFENTIRPWSRLSAQLKQDLKTLNEQRDSSSPISGSNEIFSNSLHGYILAAAHDPELQHALLNCFMSMPLDPELNPFELYIARRFIYDNSNAPIYIQGYTEEKEATGTDFSQLTFQSGPRSLSQIADLSNAILSQNADIVFIQELKADDHALELYQVLKECYAHFIYIPPSTALAKSQSNCDNGMLIASKFQMEKPQFNTFLDNNRNSNDGFFDFILMNHGITLAHIYVSNTQTNISDEAILENFTQIFAKMNDDILKSENASTPFVLNGDINTLLGTKDAKKIINAATHQDQLSNANCTLLLHSPHLDSVNNNVKANILGTSVTMHENCFGLRSVIRRTSLHERTFGAKSLLNSQQTLTSEGISTIFSRNKLQLLPVLSRNGGNDNGGAEGRIEGRITATFGGPDGTNIEISANGEINDGKGNYVSGGGGYNINTGEGSVSIGGGSRGTISEKD